MVVVFLMPRKSWIRRELTSPKATSILKSKGRASIPARVKVFDTGLMQREKWWPIIKAANIKAQ